MATPEDQHLAALHLYRRAFALVRETGKPKNKDAAAMVAEADAIMNKATFDFFKLPREIRDLIYDECLGTRHFDDNDNGETHLQYAIQNTATLKDICPQFAEEYQKRAQAKQGLVIFHSGNHIHNEIADPKPGFLTYRRITIILQLEDGQATASLHFHISWLEAFSSRLERAEQVSICFRYPSGYRVGERMWRIVQKAAQKLLEHEYVQLYLSRIRDDEVKTRAEWSCGEPMALFSRERGSFVKADEKGKGWNIG